MEPRGISKFAQEIGYRTFRYVTKILESVISTMNLVLLCAATNCYHAILRLILS
jgi:hypothetical protein